MDSGGGRIEIQPLTAEEEARKKNTDCVYFLASPLTCKKGNECEYRHSESARLNPRDCYYWLNSSCLNPKCAFRHPPLEGLFGSAGPSLPPSNTATSKPTPVTNSFVYSSNKQNVPCIYFQKGHCLKGERCPFSHGPQAIDTAAPQPVIKAPPSSNPQQPQAFKKDQFANHQSITKASVFKPSEAPSSSVKPVIKAETHSLSSHAKNLSSHPLINKLPKPQPAAHVQVQDRQIYMLDDHLQNGLEPGEIADEHLSVFDARVDDYMRGSGYSRNGDDLRSTLFQGERKPEHVNGYHEHHRPSDCKPAATYGRTQRNGSVNGFVRNGRSQECFDMRPSRISSEKSLERPLLSEKRVLCRHRSPDEVDMADLRNRLKHRRLDGHRSAVIYDHGELHRDHLSRRGHRVRSPPDNSLSTRLRSRISLPAIPADTVRFSEKDTLRRRLSPPGPINNQRRQYDRTRKPSAEPPFSVTTRSFGARITNREDDDSVNFSAPKSLAELKVAKGGVDCSSISQDQKKPECSIFEGPKPLSVLLKRKRAEGMVIEGANSSSGDESIQRSERASVCESAPAAAVEEQSSFAAESNEEDIHAVAELGEQQGGEEAEEDELTYESQSSPKEDMLGAEDYMEIDEEIEKQELAANSDGGDAEYVYEATETGHLNAEYESRGEEDDDDLDDDEAFARKIGLIFS